MSATQETVLDVWRARAATKDAPPHESWLGRSKERVRAALMTAVPSVDAEALLGEARRAGFEVEEELKATRRRAVDPLASSSDGLLARQKVERLEHDQECLVEQITALERRVEVLKGAEGSATAAAEYEAAKAERDKLAARIADRYPKLVAELIELFEAIADSDARLAKANEDLDGREWLTSAEALARGCDATFTQSRAPVTRLWFSELVAFDPSSQKAAWIRPRHHADIAERRRRAAAEASGG